MCQQGKKFPWVPLPMIDYLAGPLIDNRVRSL
jgi:hypothetical protein